MASFPLEPQHACAIVASKDYGCTSEVLDIVSIISASSKLFLDISDQREAVTEVRRKFRHPSGDHMTILNVVRAYREIAASEKKHARKEWCRKHFLNERTLLEARDIREQLVVTCGRVGIDPVASAKENEDPVIKSMGHGLAGNSAFIQPDGSYKQTMGQSVSFLLSSMIRFLFFLSFSNQKNCYPFFSLKIVKIHPASTLCDKKVPAIIYDDLVSHSFLFLISLLRCLS